MQLLTQPFQDNIVDIELLKTFIEVKNTRHFGKAAENLYKTQAAISARIKLLEGQLGTPLFTRYRNNLQLTPAGERLIQHAEAIVIAWERARMDVALRKEQKRSFNLAATNGLWDLLFQETLNTLHKQYPELVFRADAFSQDLLIRKLMERSIDFSLLYEPAKITELKSIEVTQAALILVSTEKQVDIEQAFKQNFVYVDWGTSFDISFAQEFGDIPPPVLHTSLAKIALDFILCHGGSAFLPYRMVSEYLNTQLFTVADAVNIARPIYACYHTDNQNGQVIEAIIETIKLETPSAVNRLIADC
jgi:LysR family transcriptional regulator, flagellar master operon regulator